MSETDLGDFPRHRGTDPDEEALAWLVRMTSGETSDADRAEFASWRSIPENGAAYAELDGIWDGIGQALDRPDNVVAFRPRNRRVLTWERRVAAIAASLLAIVLTHQYASYWQYDQAPRGSERGHADLADGSRIELNTGSALDVAYNDTERRVTLARGEAFFDVKRDPSKPFVIKAGAGEVRVLGTAFSVERQGEGAQVTVIRGKVRVSAAGKSIDLLPNQQVSFSGGPPRAPYMVDAKSLLAWSEGRLVLRNRPLGEVIDAVDRYYPGEIVLTNSEAAKRRVNAVVDLDRIEDWVRTLQRSQDLTAQRMPGVLFLGAKD